MRLFAIALLAIAPKVGCPRNSGNLPQARQRCDSSAKKTREADERPR